MESAPPLPSELQNAWDHFFKDTNIFLVIAGSRVGMMEGLQNYQSPLYGRFTARLAVDPLPFGAQAEFFPRYTAAERVAAYAILGGIPAYLERCDDQQTIKANVQTQIVGRSVVRELIDKFPLVVPAPDWRVHYIFFARAGFTNAARQEATDYEALLVDLVTLDGDLRRAATG